MAEKRRITGKEILDRWQAFPFELVNAMIAGELVAVNPKTGVRFSPDLFAPSEWGRGAKCFFCTKPVEWGQVCYQHKTRNPDVKSVYDPNAFSGEIVSVTCDDVRPYLTETMRADEKIATAMLAEFYFCEVEAYEQAHGLGPASEKPQEPASEIGEVNESALTPRERKELGRLRLEKEKWDTSIRAAIVVGRSLTPGNRFIKEELWKILEKSGIQRNDLPNTVFNQIWASIPTEFRNIGGRPKTGDAEDF